MRRSNYVILKETDSYVLIRDIGQWHKYMSVTNDAENVVKDLQSILHNKRLYYYDSDNQLDEIVLLEHKGVIEFGGFEFVENIEE